MCIRDRQACRSKASDVAFPDRRLGVPRLGRTTRQVSSVVAGQNQCPEFAEAPAAPAPLRTGYPGGARYSVVAATDWAARRAPPQSRVSRASVARRAPII